MPKVHRLLSILLSAAALGGCSTLAQVAGVEYNPDAPQCSNKSEAMPARIAAARAKAPDPKVQVTGSWTCVAEGYSNEYLRLSQSEGRLTAVATAGNGDSFSLEGGLDGSTALLKSSGGSYYELAVDGGAAVGDVMMPGDAFTGCKTVRTTCTRRT